jgi:hypothetical protein
MGRATKLFWLLKVGGLNFFKAGRSKFLVITRFNNQFFSITLLCGDQIPFQSPRNTTTKFFQSPQGLWQWKHVATLALARDQDKGVASGRAYK